MIDLKNIGCDPIGVVTDYVTSIHSEVGCDRGWAGSYTPQEAPYRVHHLRWVFASLTAAEAFRVTLRNTYGGNTQVMYTPPNDPSSSRVAQQPTIVGRLMPAFSIKKSSSSVVEISADLREDI